MALILVVDDDENFRNLVARALVDAGHTVVHAENGREAFKVFLSKLPQLVLTDIQMPIRDGIDLVCDIRASKSAVPIVAMTGGNVDALRIAQEVGANQGIAKGASMDFFVSQVGELLMNRQG